jgi:hypothetical protein
MKRPKCSGIRTHVVGHQQSALIGSDREYRHIVKVSETCIMSCDEINGRFTAFHAPYYRPAEIGIGLKPHPQECTFSASSNLRYKSGWEARPWSRRASNFARFRSRCASTSAR